VPKEALVETATTPTVEIERNPKRCGGKPTLASTRTTVHDIVAYVQLYDGDVRRVVKEFPHLSVEVVEGIMAWYADHREEVDEILRRRRERRRQALDKIS
jgi:uncharacterized protein (DUF433 family)